MFSTSAPFREVKHCKVILKFGSRGPANADVIWGIT